MINVIVYLWRKADGVHDGVHGGKWTTPLHVQDLAHKHLQTKKGHVIVFFNISSSSNSMYVKYVMYDEIWIISGVCSEKNVFNDAISLIKQSLIKI